MTASETIGLLRRRGVVLVPWADGSLGYRPVEALSPDERADVARQRDSILALLVADPVGWRAAVMRTQVPDRGPLPLLLARPAVHFPLGSCCSCGDRLSVDERYRCASCVAATIAVLEAAQ